VTKIHEDILITELDNDDDDDDDKKDKEGEEGEKKKDEPSLQKVPTYGRKATMKSKKSQFSMNSIEVSQVADEDMLTYLKMKKLKNLFNVCKSHYMTGFNLKLIVKLSKNLFTIL
jgi:hypothetical protein